MDINEQLNEVKWVDLGLGSETLWAASDIIVPEGMTADDVERQFREYLPSLEMIFELYHSSTWEKRPVSSRKNYRNGYVATGKNGRSIILDVLKDSREMYIARDNSCYCFYSPMRRSEELPLFSGVRFNNEDGECDSRYRRFRPVKVRKDVVFSGSGPYFVKRRMYNYEEEEVTELIFNAFSFDYSELEKKAGYEPGLQEISSLGFTNEYLRYTFRDRLVPVNLLGKRFYVRLVRCDRGWFYGSESYGQEIAILLSQYFGIQIGLEKYWHGDKSNLAVCYMTGGRYSYVYDPRQFKGKVPNLVPWNGICALCNGGIIKYPWNYDSVPVLEDVKKYGLRCQDCPFFLGWKEPDHAACSLPAFSWPDEK